MLPIAVSNIYWNEQILDSIHQKMKLQNIINSIFYKNDNTHLKNCTENGLEDVWRQ